MIRFQVLKRIPRRKRRADVKSGLLLVVGKMLHRIQEDAPKGHDLNESSVISTGARVAAYGPSTIELPGATGTKDGRISMLKTSMAETPTSAIANRSNAVREPIEPHLVIRLLTQVQAVRIGEDSVGQ